MNKQEVIKELKAKKDRNEKLLEIEEYDIGFKNGTGEALNNALFIVKQLDEPEKPVVPQFVADWYEKNCYSLERNIYTLCIQSYQKEVTNKEFYLWFDDVRNKAIETLVKMKLYGYGVKKEKLYTVELPNPNDAGHVVLYKDKNGKITIEWDCAEDWKRFEGVKLTESEIKKDFAWTWQFAEEVEE